jgi:hypothetical protein
MKTPRLQDQLRSANLKSKWSDRVTKKAKYHPPSGTFEKTPPEIARQLKKDSKDYEQASKRLNFHINRAGKNLSVERQKELEQAKDILIKLYTNNDIIKESMDVREILASKLKPSKSDLEFKTKSVKQVIHGDDVSGYKKHFEYEEKDSDPESRDFKVTDTKELSPDELDDIDNYDEFADGDIDSDEDDDEESLLAILKRKLAEKE